MIESNRDSRIKEAPRGRSKQRQDWFGAQITRRDFVNGVAAGAAFTVGAAKAYGQAASDPLVPPLGDDWYGFGGVVPYRHSHGNAPEVVEAAHRILDRQFPVDFDRLASVEETDLVIVGGGMAGLGAALEFSLRKRERQTCILLDNIP